MLRRAAIKDLPPEFTGSLEKESLWIQSEFDRITEIREQILQIVLDARRPGSEASRSPLNGSENHPASEFFVVASDGWLNLFQSREKFGELHRAYTERVTDLTEKFHPQRDEFTKKLDTLGATTTALHDVAGSLDTLAEIWTDDGKPEQTSVQMIDHVNRSLAAAITRFLFPESQRKFSEMIESSADPLIGALMRIYHRPIAALHFMGDSFGDKFKDAFTQVAGLLTPEDRELFSARYVDKKALADLPGLTSPRTDSGRAALLHAHRRATELLPEDLEGVRLRQLAYTRRQQLLDA